MVHEWHFFLKNHVIERFWVEVNQRVNKPLKDCLLRFERCKVFDTDNPVELFCVSWVTIRVSIVGSTLLINSWNEHAIPGKGAILYNTV